MAHWISIVKKDKTLRRFLDAGRISIYLGDYLKSHSIVDSFKPSRFSSV